MARKKLNSVCANVFLSPEDYNALKQGAEAEGSNVSLIIRRLVKKDLAKSAQAINED